jgi:hypothetical protein
MPKTSQKEQPVLVVGAGITGLSAAWLLRRQGYTVEVRDSKPQAGGLLAPIEFRGLPCDKGSHRIHPQAHPLLLELTQGANWERKDRRGILVLGGQHMTYPLQMIDFLQGLGAKTAAHMAATFLLKPGARRGFRQWESDRSDVSRDIGFEQFVIARVGQRAYTQFYAPYVEKVWGLSPNEISQTVAKSRVSTSSPLSMLRKALRPKPGDDSAFLYPRGGMAELVDFFLTGLWTAGVSIHFDSPVTEKDVREWPGPVFYSGHLSDLAPSQGLRHRGLYLLHIALPKNSVGPTDTFYLPEGDFLFGRVSQPARFSSDFENDDVDILCAEIPEGRHGSDEDFTAQVDRIQTQLVSAGIVASDTPIIDMEQNFLPRVYPLYTRGWLNRWREALESVAELGNVYPIGRQGLFLHCNVDQCVHIADEAVSHLVKGGQGQSWIEKAEDFLELRVRD